MKYSVLKYGSVVRGNSDKYSDKDILIVAEDYNDLKKISLQYTNEGWSVSLYTYNKLEYLSQKGFLFVKHLINEGIIEFDPNNRLKKILENFRETKNYNKEIKETQSFFNFIHVIPNNSISYLWLCDNLYVNFRNFLIFNSALNRNYKFSYPELIEELLYKDLINQNEFKILADLRVLKSCYRNTYSDIIPDKDYLNKILLIMNRFNIETNFIFTDDFASIKKITLNKNQKPYKNLRLIELIFNNLGIKDEYLEKCITNPQMYANSKSINKVYNQILNHIRTTNNSNFVQTRFCV